MPFTFLLCLETVRERVQKSTRPLAVAIHRRYLGVAQSDPLRRYPANNVMCFFLRPSYAYLRPCYTHGVGCCNWFANSFLLPTLLLRRLHYNIDGLFVNN